MRPIDADALCEGRVSNDPVVIAAKCAPTIDCVRDEPGEWLAVIKPNRWGGAKLRCSKCNAGSIRHWKHCPNCGKKMDGGKSNA